MLQAPQRSYQADIVSRLKMLNPKLFRASIIKSSVAPEAYIYLQTQYELWGVESVPLTNRDSRPHVLITGGIHGNEPAGTLAVMEFLLQHAKRWSKRIRFTCIPCVNPSGYEFVTRGTLDGTDLNRNFSTESSSAETRLVRHWLESKGGHKGFDETFDVHECFPGVGFEGLDPEDYPLGYFLWELCDSRKRRFGDQIIEAASKLVPICVWQEILGERSVNGVISYPESAVSPIYAAGNSLDCYLVSSNLTEHAFTLESPGVYSLERRVAAHVAALNAAMAAILNKK